jgi:hypothetical protein
MQCENVFCAYWQNYICRLEQITLDIQGKCRECVYVEPDAKLLNRERNKILKRYETKK